MKKFRYRYSPLVWALIGVVIALTTGGLIWNVFNLVQYMSVGDNYKAIVYIVTVLFNLLLAIFSVSLTFNTAYRIGDEAIIMSFGLFRSKIPLKDVISVKHFKVSDKLVLYKKDATFSVIVISPAKYDDFVKAIREKRTEIFFESESEE